MIKLADLFPSCPTQRENTITSAPSLMVLVLKPFPSVPKRMEYGIQMKGDKELTN